MVKTFLLALLIRTVVGSRGGSGQDTAHAICDANLDLISNHPNINQNVVAPGPVCEIPDERNVVVARGASVPIRLYHASGPRRILGWLLYVVDSTNVRRGNFTAVTPNIGNGVLSGVRGATCNDTSTITHSAMFSVAEVNAQWQMPANAQDGTYSFQALVLTADADGSNQKFFVPRCSSACLDTRVSCQTQSKSSLVGAQGYLEVFNQNNVISCSSSDTVSPCPSGICDVSADPARMTGVCEAVYVSYAWVNALPARRCDLAGYTFTIPRPGSGFEVLVSGGGCSDDAPLSVALNDNLIQLTNSNGPTFVRALRQNNCVQLGCNLNAWKSVHRGYYDKEDGSFVTRFDVRATPSQNYFCMLPGPSAGECYCDDACTRLRDCCADFASTCKTSSGANLSP